MNDLLAFAVAAHGGLDRWNTFTSVRTDLSIDGAIWHAKQVPGLLLDKVFEADTRLQRLTVTPFGGGDSHLVFTPARLSIEGRDGAVREVRDNPAAAFAGQTFETPWDKFHAGFFTGEALWTYLTLPFLYTYPGFEVEEIEPWHEDGETWRSLKATFPDSITSHTTTQITRFGPDGLMRRHDYTVDILGGATGANYTSDYRDFQGIKMPTKRRIFSYDAAMRKIPEPLLVAIDFRTLTFR
ncbi:hypothetical protein [Bosea sp. TAB14]|uniref:hypothetical protein n=1 Tax=Bosea sp. TAB14 TaxID=3237481 RepID=UPI003F939483